MDGDGSDKTFLVWVYNVSQDQPYTVFRALTSSTAQDIIAQVQLHHEFEIIVKTNV